MNPHSNPNVSFSVVRNIGNPKVCYVQNPYNKETEYTVQYQEKVWFDNYGMVECINDGAHFTFLDPVKISPLDPLTQRWFALCSCGAPAVLVGHNPLKSKTSEMGHYWLACYNAITYERHSDGSRGY